MHMARRAWATNLCSLGTKVEAEDGRRIAETRHSGPESRREFQVESDLEMVSQSLCTVPSLGQAKQKKELCRGRWRTVPEANAGCRGPAWDALQAADSFAAYRATTQSKATFDQTCAANAARVQNAEAKVTEASIATTEHSTAVVRDQLGLGSADAVGDQHGQGAASAVGDQQDSTSGVASLFVFLQSVFANLLPESLQKGDRLFTGDSMTRLLV